MCVKCTFRSSDRAASPHHKSVKWFWLLGVLVVVTWAFQDQANARIWAEKVTEPRFVFFVGRQIVVNNMAERQQHGDINSNVAQGSDSQYPIRDGRPLPPFWTLLLTCGCFTGFLRLVLWVGGLYVYDLRPRWCLIVGSVAALALGMSGFCVLLWGGIL